MPEKLWYAVYVRSRAEKKVFTELQIAEIETFLPTIIRWRQWSDRLKKVEEPLFRGYVFVHIEEREYFKVLQTPNVVKFISFEGKAVPIPPAQIEAIKHFLKDPEEIDLPELNEGQLVRIKSGSMMGISGRMIKYKNKHRIWIMIDAVGQYVHLNIPRSKVEAVHE